MNSQCRLCAHGVMSPVTTFKRVLFRLIFSKFTVWKRKETACERFQRNALFFLLVVSKPFAALLKGTICRVLSV